MADPVVDPLHPANPATATQPSSEDTVSIRFISPSWEGSDLPHLADLAVSTTIGQLRDRVQQEIATRGRSSQGMRLIYRGRVLDANEKTLQDIFGPNIESEAVAVHLVLRDLGEHGNTLQQQQQQQQPHQQQQQPHQQQQQQHQQQLYHQQQQYHQQQLHHHYLFHQQQPSAFTASLQNGTPNPTTALPNQAQAFHHQQQAFHAFHHHQHQAALNAHWARHWAAVDSVRRGVPMAAPNNAHLHYAPNAPNAPNATMPSGHPPNMTGSGYPPTGNAGREQDVPSDAEVANMFSVGNSTSVHNPSAPNMAGLSQRQVYGAQPLRHQTSPLVTPGAATGTTAGTTTTPEMYILYSPSGQRWLLVHGDADVQLSPMQPAPGMMTAAGTAPGMAAGTPAGNAARIPGGWVPPTGHNTNEQPLMHAHVDEHRMLQIQLEQQSYRNRQLMRMLQQQNFDQGRLQLYQQYIHQQHQQEQQHQRMFQMQQQQQQQRQRVAPLRPIFPRRNMRINNPGAGMLAAAVPHIWLIMRLLLFVWWFTSPDASWTRWVMVIILATVMFLVNTGMLDGLTNQVWAPIRHHLDGLLPGANDIAANTNRAPAAPARAEAVAAAPATARNDAAGGVGAGAAGAASAGAEPNPEQMATRLVGERRQANAERLMDMVRRIERVGIMFLASLAPGVVERHVALVEQRQAEAARRLQEQEQEQERGQQTARLAAEMARAMVASGAARTVTAATTATAAEEAHEDGHGAEAEEAGGNAGAAVETRAAEAVEAA